MPQTAQPPIHVRGDVIPRVMLRAMAGIVAFTLAVTAFATLTDREPVGQPKAAPVIAERTLVLINDGGNAVRVLDQDGAEVLALDNGGFMVAVMNGLNRERLKQGVTGDPLVRLTSMTNGRLTLSDAATGWSVELAAFGQKNAAVFRQLLD